MDTVNAMRMCIISNIRNLLWIFVIPVMQRSVALSVRELERSPRASMKACPVDWTALMHGRTLC